MAIDGGETFLDFMNRLGDPARHAGYDDDMQERTSQPDVKMSERAELMKAVFAKKAGSATDAELQLLEVVAAELDDLANHPRGDLFGGIMIGRMEGDDYGHTFEQLTQHICGNGLQPSFLGIESVLVELRKKYASGWRLVPPTALSETNGGHE